MHQNFFKQKYKDYVHPTCCAACGTACSVNLRPAVWRCTLQAAPGRSSCGSRRACWRRTLLWVWTRGICGPRRRLPPWVGHSRCLCRGGSRQISSGCRLSRVREGCRAFPIFARDDLRVKDKKYSNNNWEVDKLRYCNSCTFHQWLQVIYGISVNSFFKQKLIQ